MLPAQRAAATADLLLLTFGIRAAKCWRHAFTRRAPLLPLLLFRFFSRVRVIAYAVIDSSPRCRHFAASAIFMIDYFRRFDGRLPPPFSLPPPAAAAADTLF
jgi:hypothetical protein